MATYLIGLSLAWFGSSGSSVHNVSKKLELFKTSNVDRCLVKASISQSNIATGAD